MRPPIGSVWDCPLFSTRIRIVSYLRGAAGYHYVYLKAPLPRLLGEKALGYTDLALSPATYIRVDCYDLNPMAWG